MTASNYEQTRARRHLLEITDNPDTNLDYVSSFSANLRLTDAAALVQFTLDYVPDRHIISRQILTTYLKTIETCHWDSLEHAASTILNDFNNELVCRWVRVSLELKTNGPEARGLQTQCILVEDSQPGWNNETLISRV